MTSPHPTATGTDGLAALLERVEKCTKPNHELDMALSCALLDMREHGSFWDWMGTRRKGLPDPEPEDFWRRFAKPLTASLDAVLALVEAKLPGWNVSMATESRSVAIIPPGPDSYGQCDACTGHSRGRPTLALGVCEALLRALIAQQEKAPANA
jgi:hypothetical protein